MRLKQLRITAILKLEDAQNDLAEFIVDQLLCFVFDLSKSSLINQVHQYVKITHDDQNFKTGIKKGSLKETIYSDKDICNHSWNLVKKNLP